MVGLPSLNRFQMAGVAAYLAGYRQIALQAGWGTGKSFLLALIALLAGEQGVSVLWVTDTGPRLDKVVQPACEMLLPQFGWRYIASERRWTKNGASIWLQSYFRPSTRSAESSSAEGSNVGLVLLDEAQVFTTSEVLRKLSGRVRVGPVPPVVVMAGLPVWNAWWVRETAKMPKGVGCVIHGTSFDNRGVLRPEWFEDQFIRLGRKEFRAMLLNEPQPPEGQIYSEWSSDPYPAGNIIHGWQWRPTMRTVWGLDFGWVRPAGILLAEDRDLGAWVICGEANPRKNVRTTQFATELLKVAWPRRLIASKPADVPFVFHEAIADPAGKGHLRDTGRTDLDILAENPGSKRLGGGGIGLRPLVLEADPEDPDDDYADRKDIRSGIIRVGRAFERRQVLCTAEVWKAGESAPDDQRSFARAVVGYRTDARGEPKKGEGFDDVLDALRYFVRWPGSGLWSASAWDGGRMPRISSDPYRGLGRAADR
jgi:hypothetical protein